MKAMILAAGLGTRLRPLTNDRPKALVEINGRTLLEITLTRLKTFGVTDAIINVHHFADRVVDYLKAHKNFGLHIEISREDDLLLDTGGGLRKAAWFFSDPNRLDEPFVLHNVDVLTDIDLSAMLAFHRQHQALATLAVRQRPSSRLLLFNAQNQLLGRLVPPSADTIQPSSVIPSEAKDPGVISTQSTHDNATAICHSERSEESAFRSASRGAKSESTLAFSGVHIISPRLLPMLTETGVFSIIDAYVRVAAQGHRILAFRADQYYWRDLGRPSDLTKAASDLQQKAFLL
jgi:NDP-sugar pyrophosphorylase family protein